MKGWVGLVGWPVADGLPTLVVTHQLQVERRIGKVRQSETDVLPLCQATNFSIFNIDNIDIDIDTDNYQVSTTILKEAAQLGAFRSMISAASRQQPGDHTVTAGACIADNLIVFLSYSQRRRRTTATTTVDNCANRAIIHDIYASSGRRSKINFQRCCVLVIAVLALICSSIASCELCWSAFLTFRC